MKNYEKFIERPIDIRKLSQNELTEILNEVKGIVEKEDLLLKFNANKICFIGDIHGDLMAGAQIARYIWKNEDIDKFVFLGDYVDRGNYQLETLNLALLLKILDPDRIVLLRGNHETTLANRFYGFKVDLMNRDLIDMYETYNKFFALLPVSAIINSKIFAVHGGLPTILVAKEIDTINELPRDDVEGTNPTLMELLWNDPNELIDTFAPSMRGGGIFYFGKVAFEKFMKKNGFELFVRAHEFFKEGYKFFFNNKLLSLFSSANYVGRKVDAKIAIIDSDLNVDLLPVMELKIEKE